MLRTMLRGLLAVISTTLVIAHPHPAASQMMRTCAGRSEVVNFLDRNFAEKLTAVGQINQNAVLEVYAAESGTWTLIITDDHGVSCFLLSGDSWRHDALSAWRAHIASAGRYPGAAATSRCSTSSRRASGARRAAA